VYRTVSRWSAAKAGIPGFTRTLAIKLGPFGITANSIAPGFIETAMTEATATRLGITIDQMRRRIPAVRGSTVSRKELEYPRLPADIAISEEAEQAAGTAQRLITAVGALLPNWSFFGQDQALWADA
jgi:NAD(P)-dependent dehydrogenase (short-subunit alcohol dehydrogenase family)